MENEFIILTDSSCDLPDSYLRENEIITVQLSFTLDGQTYHCNEMEPEEFYQRVRAGAMPITAQVNVEDARRLLEPLLQEGRDVLYIAFSSALSGTFHSGQVAVAELCKKYPERSLVIIDSLCASLGQGLLVHKANLLRREGKSIDEVAQWTRDNLMRVAHYVTVDDLMHLHRGGRVSKASAVVGSMLSVKPLIHMNNEGKLVVIDKMRGRKQALHKMVDLLADAVGDTENDVCFISHSDCVEDAAYVSGLVRERYGIRQFQINFIGPVIGAHTGAGTVAVFLMAERR